jgi:CRP/FNR family transcriptional regulator, cyclic AMP receptor protein
MSTIQSEQALYELLGRAGETKRVAAGGVVFEKGTRGDTMFVLSAGVVGLTDGERVLDTVRAPGLFGELALIESTPRALTATVEEDAELVEIPARMFWVLVNETPYFAQLVMRVMAERLRRASGT